MKTSNIRHNLFSKTDHDKVFIEKNYQAAVERNQVMKEEIPMMMMMMMVMMMMMIMMVMMKDDDDDDMMMRR
jgi:hypothetical protein